MAEIQRPGALYRQVAAAIRDAIAAGEYPPGSPLPSEAQLIERYEVSRPTVRNAISALRAEGLIEVIHGKGSFVRAAPTALATVNRTVTQDKDGTFHAGYDAWQLRELPTVHRTHTTTETGTLLDLPDGEPLFGVDRLYVHPETGARMAHRTLIPFATAEGTDLADHPDASPEAIYAILAKAGHTLSWHETARARMPLPDERESLQLPDATPVLHATRITHGTDDRPLILEELRTSGDRAQAAYRIAVQVSNGLRIAGP
ncbi:GntR family transcriptional regulator [Streptomyces sp. 4N509B]|uniref:GntR family transcriptional regulator n=1 Tax=Streptomyces sp. 4N509B TaxID=3457413 RepID=UPI003FD182DB